jgi:predicted RNA-binding protein
VPSYWTLSGTLENWKVALEKGVWGVSERARGLWAKVQPGDIVVFYAKGAARAETLARMMVYVLMNKIIFYKVLERHYKLDELKRALSHLSARLATRD